MYIMAAVDVDVRETKRLARGKATAAAKALRGGVRGAEHEGSSSSKWNAERDYHSSPLPHFHEQLICTIEAHQNGTLKIAPGTISAFSKALFRRLCCRQARHTVFVLSFSPINLNPVLTVRGLSSSIGFSEEEPESGDEGAFITDHTAKVNTFDRPHLAGAEIVWLTPNLASALVLGSEADIKPEPCQGGGGSEYCHCCVSAVTGVVIVACRVRCDFERVFTMVLTAGYRANKVMDKEGARLTTYRFTSPSGGVFSYTVENDSEPAGGVEEMERWEAEEASRVLWKKAARQQVYGRSVFSNKAR